ncbi:MAG: Fe-S protein assembly chaperone HscA [Buchnera aphidicola (Chaetogeoica yunlongensis)]
MITLNKINKKNNTFKKISELSIGIDFGTTYSLVSTVIKNNVYIITDKYNRALLPSIVNYSIPNKTLVGWQAENMVINDPINTIISVKRLIGYSYTEIKKLYPNLPYHLKNNTNNTLSFITNNGKKNIVEVCSQIFMTLRNRVISTFNQEFKNTVITVPAHFDEKQRQEIKKSAELCKLNVIRLINEPTAAAISYGLYSKKNKTIAVYDLGGGTFDISILKLHEGIFEVLATSGNIHLGGDDFDQLLIDYILKKTNLLNTEINNFTQRKLLHLAKSIKIKLTSIDCIKFQLNDQKFYKITRLEFNSIIEPLILKTLRICQKVLHDANIDLKNIEEIILVGGSTYIPILRKKIADFFQKEPLSSINPDQVVVAGAAIQANMLTCNNNKNNFILLDVVSLSLGIEVIGETVEKIILKNTKLPTSKTKIFTTFKDGQKTILIHVVQGEKELVKDCRSLSRFVLKNIPSKPAGKIIIVVNFQIDVNGLLSVMAKIKSTKIKQKITVNFLKKS